MKKFKEFEILIFKMKWISGGIEKKILVSVLWISKKIFHSFYNSIIFMKDIRCSIYKIASRSKDCTKLGYSFFAKFIIVR